MFKAHFISGLPRSGSTLLSAILKQNPRFTAGISSPVGNLINATLPQMSGSSELAVFFDQEKRQRILRGLFTGYYGALSDDCVVFDTNRQWTTRMAMLDRLFPGSRVICCVRDIGWIFDSFERAIRNNPLHMSRLGGEKPVSTVYGRTENFMNTDHGIVGFPWSGLREAWFSEYAQNLIMVPYDRLAGDPVATIKALYEILEEPLFAHRFDDVEYEEEKFDAQAGTPNLHKVRKNVTLDEREPVIPPDLFQKYAGSNFWNNPKLNSKNVVIL